MQPNKNLVKIEDNVAQIKLLISELVLQPRTSATNHR